MYPKFLAFWLFPSLSIPIVWTPALKIPGDVRGEKTDLTLVLLQPLKPALQLDFFMMFLLFQFVAMSLKIVELNWRKTVFISQRSNNSSLIDFQNLH